MYGFALFASTILFSLDGCIAGFITEVNSTNISRNSTTRLNVLFLISDDLRPELGCYNGPDATSPVHPKMHTPNLDKLASRSLLLTRAYSQIALCSPSRTSFLTGRRPDTTHVYDIGPHFRKVGGNFVTLPEYFKQRGYVTASVGKVFHKGLKSNLNDPQSWTEPSYYAPNYRKYREIPESWRAVSKKAQIRNPLPDQQITQAAIKRLERYSKQKKPFFLAVGLRKPHMPFVFPEEFKKFYPQEAVHLPPNPYAPAGMPPIAWNNYMHGSFGKYKDIVKHGDNAGNINGTLPKRTVLELRRAYYSCVSYMDSLVGNILRCVTRKQTLRSLSLSYQKKDGHPWSRPSFFWYDPSFFWYDTDFFRI